MTNPYASIDEYHHTQGVTLTQEMGIHLPQHYEHSLEESIQACQQGLGILDLKAANILKLHGTDAQKFLQSMVTNDITLMEVHQSQPHLICQHKGKIKFHVDLYRAAPEEYWVLTEPWEGVQVGNYLNQYHIRESFSMSLLNPDYVRLDLFSQNVQAATSKVLTYDPQTSGYTFQSYTLASTLAPFGSLQRVTLVVPNVAVATLMQHLVEQCSDAKLIGTDALSELSLHEQVPEFGKDYTVDQFPAEASLDNHISYTKGCYLGQEVHARMHHRGHPNWKLVALESPSKNALEAGTGLFFQQEHIGDILRVSHTTSKGSYHATARIAYRCFQQRPQALETEHGEDQLTLVPLSHSATHPSHGG